VKKFWEKKLPSGKLKRSGAKGCFPYSRKGDGGAERADPMTGARRDVGERQGTGRAIK